MAAFDPKAVTKLAAAADKLASRAEKAFKAMDSLLGGLDRGAKAFKAMDRVAGPLASKVDRVTASVARLSPALDALVGKITRAANTAAKAAAGIPTGGRGGSPRTPGGSQFERMADSGISSFVTGMNQALEIGAKVVGVVEAIGSAVGRTATAFGRFVIGNVEQRETALATLRTLLQDEAAAQRVWSETVEAAAHTPFSTGEVMADRVRLITAGYSEAESRMMYAAVADIQAAFHDPERGQILIRAFERIRGEGGIHGGTMRELLAAGVSQQGLFRRLAEQAGRQDLLNNEHALAAWAHSRLQNMSGNQSVQAVLETIQARMDPGAALGTLAVRQSETLTGIMSNIMDLPNTMMLSYSRGIETLPGIEGLKRTLREILGLFDTTTERGARFQNAIMRVTDALFRGLFGTEAASGGDRMGAILDMITSTIEQAADLFDRIMPSVREFFAGFATGVIESFRGAMANLGGTGTMTPEAWGRVGRAIGDFGTILGATLAAARAMVEVFVDLYQGMVDLWHIAHADWGAVGGSGRTSDPGARAFNANPRAFNNPAATPPPNDAPTPNRPVVTRHEHEHTVGVNVHATGDSEANQAAARAVGNHVTVNLRDAMRGIDLAHSDF